MDFNIIKHICKTFYVVAYIVFLPAIAKSEIKNFHNSYSVSRGITETIPKQLGLILTNYNVHHGRKQFNWSNTSNSLNNDTSINTIKCCDNFSCNNDHEQDLLNWQLKAFNCLAENRNDSAVYYLQKTFTYHRAQNNIRAMRITLNGLFQILLYLDTKPSAIQQMRKNDQLILTESDSLLLPVFYYNKARLYNKYNQNDSCISNYETAIRYSVQYNDTITLLLAYRHLSICYLKQNDLSRWYNKNAILIELSEKFKINSFAVLGNIELMRYEMNRRDFSKAISIANRLHTKYLKNLDKQTKIEIDSTLYVAHYAMNDNENAIKYLESYFEQKFSCGSFNPINEPAPNQEKSDQINNSPASFAMYAGKLIASNSIFPKMLFFALITFILIIIFRTKLRLYLIRISFRLSNKEGIRAENQKGVHSQVVMNTIGVPLTSKVEFDNDSELKNEPISQKWLYDNLCNLFETNKLHLKADLDLEYVVKALGTNKKYLYFALNRNNENFRGFVNKFRVNEAKMLIEISIREKQIPNFNDIVENSGFNSIVTFYRAFKSVTGMTPKEYANEHCSKLHQNHDFK